MSARIKRIGAREDRDQYLVGRPLMTVGQQLDDTRDRLISILTSPTHMSLQLSASDINDETSLISDLGLDSIQLLEFSIAIEDAFGINIAESIERSTLDRFANLVALVGAARRASNTVSRSTEN